MHRLAALVLLLPLALTAADAPVLDGDPKLGVEFLLPDDTSRFDPKKAGGTQRVFETTPSYLNPLTSNEAIVSNVYGTINDTLAARPAWAPERWMGQLAESVVITDDWKTYTIRVRRGVLWQRPVIASKPEFAWLDKDVELTSGDFKFALDTILNPGVDCPAQRNYYEDIAQVTTPDEHTLVVTWKRAVYTSISATLGLEPLPRHVYGRNRDGSEIPAAQFAATFNKHWFDETKSAIGVGEFQLVAYEPDQQLRFTRFAKSWHRTSYFDEIVWRLDVKKPDAKLVGFKNGQSHTEGLTPLQYKAEILDGKEPRFAPFNENDPKAGRAGVLGWEKVQSTSFTYLGWNIRKPLFADKRTRQAMSHAFPKNRIIRETFVGLGQPILADVVVGSRYYNTDLKPYAFDLKKAKELLTAAGWADSDGDGLLDRQVDGRKVDFSFTFKYVANSPEMDNALSIYKNELRKIGIDLKPLPMEWKELVRVYEDRDFDAVFGGWRMGWDVDFYQLWHSSQADVPSGSNHCGFRNARVDELADTLRLTFDTDKRIAIAKEIQATIHDEQPYTFFRAGQGIFVWQNRPAPGAPAEPGRWLDGVVRGLDELPPLTNRSPVYWSIKP